MVVTTLDAADARRHLSSQAAVMELRARAGFGKALMDGPAAKRATPLWALIARRLFWSSVLMIAILSLLPGELRPRTGFPGILEHAAAYAAAGCCFAIGYGDWRLRLLGLAGFALAAGVFEIIQGAVPGRSPNAIDALASAGGWSFGLVAAALIVGALKTLRAGRV
jgi:hypothetical protein